VNRQAVKLFVFSSCVKTRKKISSSAEKGSASGNSASEDAKLQIALDLLCSTRQKSVKGNC